MAKSSIDSLKQQQAKPYDMVLIVGPNISLSKIKESYEDKKKSGINCVIIGDGVKPVTDEELSVLKDRLAPHTRIDIYMHGVTNNKEHRVQVSDKSYPIPIAPPLGNMAKLKNLLKYGSFSREGNVMSSNDITTAEMFDKIKNYAGNNPVDGMQVHLWSCFGGAAAKDLDHLPDKAVLITHAAKSTILTAMVEDTLIAGIKRYPNSPHNEFAHNMTESAQNATVTFNGKDGRFKHKVKAPQHPVTLPEELTRYLEHSVEGYKKALDKAGVDRETLGEIPHVTEDGVEKYRREACIIEVNKGNVSYFNEYIKKTSEVPDSLQLSSTHTALHIAANVAGYKNTVDVIKQIVKKGGDVNKPDDKGNTSLHLAVETGYMPAVDVILAHGGDIKKADIYGNTVLHKAVGSGNQTMVSHLIEKGADVKQGDNYGITALHDAAASGNLPMVTAIIKHGGVVNQVDSYGNTALHVAAMRGYENIVGALLDKDADVTLKNREGKTACDCARDAGHLKIAETLERENTVYFHHSESTPEPLSPRLSPSGNSEFAVIAKNLGDTGMKLSSSEIAKPSSSFQASVQTQHSVKPPGNER